MALANCNECGKELSEHAEACPHCATPAKIALQTFRVEQEQERRKKGKIDHAGIEEAIRAKLNKSEGDLTQLTTLNLSNNQITDITPLKDLTQLETLEGPYVGFPEAQEILLRHACDRRNQLGSSAYGSGKQEHG